MRMYVSVRLRAFLPYLQRVHVEKDKKTHKDKEYILEQRLPGVLIEIEAYVSTDL